MGSCQPFVDDEPFDKRVNRSRGLFLLTDTICDRQRAVRRTEEAIPLPALPQTRFLRPVPSRGRPSFFPVFSHHAARTFLFGATSIGKPQLSRPRNGRSRKRPLPFRGDPSFARPQVPHARQGYLQRKPIKKGLWRHHRPFIIFRSYGSGYCPNAFSRASSSVPAV